MNKIKIICIIGIIIPLSLFSATRWLPLTHHPSGTPPIVEVIESNYLKSIIHITVPGFWVRDTIIDGTDYQIITLPECGSLCEIGDPQLPKVQKLVAIPPRTDVSISYEFDNPSIFANFSVYPYQQINPTKHVNEPFIINHALYASPLDYPCSIIEIDDPSIMMNLRVVNINCCPIIYEPAQNKLRVHSDIIVELQYEGLSENNYLKNGYPCLMHPLYDAIYRNLILNYDWLDIPIGFTADRTHGCNFLVITPSLYLNELDPFIRWKHKKGYGIRILTPMDIVYRPYFIITDTAVIHDTVTNAFFTSSAQEPCYLMIVGDLDAVPTDTFQNCFGSSFPSDHYYACITGDDEYPDIAVGRLSVESPSPMNTVANIVNKVFFYERWSATDWAAGRALMVSHYQDDEDLSFNDTTQYIINEFFSETEYLYYDIWGGHPNGYTNVDIKNRIENFLQNYYGVGVVNYFGHGEYDRWVDWNVSQSFTVNDVHGLANEEHYPIVLNCCCSNGEIQQASEAMVEAWLRASDGGAVGTLGANWVVHQTPQNPVGMPTEVFRAAFDLDINEIGWAINYAKDVLLPHQLLLRDNAVMYNWYGDPTLAACTVSPTYKTLFASHPGYIYTGPQLYTVTVSSLTGLLRNALVCIYKEEIPELWQKAYTDANGKAYFFINPQNGGELYVTVSKYNYRPYEGECTVMPFGSGPQTRLGELFPRELCIVKAPTIFRDRGILEYGIPYRSDVCISLYSILGNLIQETKIKNTAAGYYEHEIDVSRLPSGVYFLVLENSEKRISRKILVIH